MASLTWKQHRILNIISTGTGVVCLALGGLYDWSTIRWPGWTLIIIGAILAMTPSIIEFFHEVTYERQEALRMLLWVIHLVMGIEKAYDFRITLLKVNSRQRLEQIARASNDGDQCGTTTMSTSQGLAGYCYRDKSTILENDVQDFIRQMVEWGFTRDEAARFRNDRKAYACIPVTNSLGTVIAVVSLDANFAFTFKPQHIKIAELTSIVLARLLTKPERD